MDLMSVLSRYLFNELYGRGCDQFSLWTKNGVVLDSDAYCRWIADALAEYGFPVNLSSYRHISKIFMRTFIRDPTLESFDTLEEQSGHGIETAEKVYGRLEGIAEVSEEFLLKFYRASHLWHLLLLDPDAEQKYFGLCARNLHYLEKPILADSEVVNCEPSTKAGDDNSCESNNNNNISVSEADNVENEAPVLLPIAETRKESITTHKVEIAEALDIVTGKENSKFRSNGQELATRIVGKNEKNVIVILPTGKGKSATVFVPVVMEKKMTVLIVPIVSLKQDVIKRCINAGLEYSIYDPGQSGYPSSGIMLVTIEHAATERFRGIIKTMTKNIARIVIDEAHLIWQWNSFRPAFLELKYLSIFPMPIVCLSASFPPFLEAYISNFFQRSFTIVRESCDRRNIQYALKVLQLPLKFLCLDNLNQLIPEPQDRGIIYVQAIKDIEVIRNEIGSTSSIYGFFGEMEEDQKAAVMEDWFRGQCKWIVATCAFGLGIDYPCVRCVIHYGIPRDVLSFYQESGRAGRDGLLAKSIILTNKGELKGNNVSIVEDGAECENMFLESRC
jgi:hypothetical protein